MQHRQEAPSVSTELFVNYILFLNFSWALQYFKEHSNMTQTTITEKYVKKQALDH